MYTFEAKFLTLIKLKENGRQKHEFLKPVKMKVCDAS